MTRRAYYLNELAGLGWMTVRVGFLLAICVLELFRRPA